MSDTTPTPEQGHKASPVKKISQRIKQGFEHVHKKIGFYGWTSLALLVVLIATVAHYECRDFYRMHRFMPRPMYIHMNDNWMGDIDRDFQNIQRQMDGMRVRHEQMMRDAWDAPIDPKAITTSIASQGDYQYSVNTKDGKLDGFVSTTDATKASTLLTQVKGLGLTVDQKDNKLFFSGDAQKMPALMKLIGR